MRFFEILTEDVNSFNLKEHYLKFNSLYFEGKLPISENEIKIKYGSLKRITGKVTAKIMSKGMAYRNFPKTSEYWQLQLPLVMTISNFRNLNDEYLTKILLHEMIHVYVMYVLGEYGENHGPKFLTTKNRISKMSGIDIPLVDDLESMLPYSERSELTKSTGKQYKLLINQKNNGDQNFSLYTINVDSDEIKDSIIPYVNAGYYTHCALFFVNDPFWERLTAEITVMRKPLNKRYKIFNKEILEMTAKSSLIWDVKKQ